MAREGLMDDCGYDFFDASECSNYENCSISAYEQGRNDAIEELLSRILTHSNIFKEIGWDSDCIDINTIKIICDELKEQNK